MAVGKPFTAGMEFTGSGEKLVSSPVICLLTTLPNCERQKEYYGLNRLTNNYCRQS